MCFRQACVITIEERGGDRGGRGGGANADGFSKMQEIPDIYYDGLHRLTQVDYDLGGGSTQAEQFDYDDLGNRVTYQDHRNSITTAYQSNVVNEYTSIEDVGGAADPLDVLHDPAGNLSQQIVDITGGTTKLYEYDYDDDNRLMSVDYKETGQSDIQVADYAYDALGRLISSQMRFDSDSDADSETLKYYYGERSEREPPAIGKAGMDAGARAATCPQGASRRRTTGGGQNAIAEVDESDDMQRRYVHGTTYIDERAIMIAGDPDVETPQIDTYYYLLQELYTAVGLIKRNGTLAEANTYDGYGEVDQWGYRGERSEREPPATGKAGTDAGARAATCPQGASTKRATGGFDFNRDGDVDSGDQNVMNALVTANGVPTSDPTGDYDMDGDVDGDATTGDLKAFNDAMTDSGVPPITLNVSALGNPYHFTGRRLFFTEDLAASGEGTYPNRQIQYNRNRFYKPDDGRWLQRDPIGYANGMNLYEYVRSRPTRLRDPFGRVATLDGSLDALQNFVTGLGEPAELSGRLLSVLKTYTFYEDILAGLSAQAERLLPRGCDERKTRTIWKSLSEVSTGGSRTLRSGDLNPTIGTINSIQWRLSCQVVAGRPFRQDNGCCCNRTANCTVRFFLDDRYSFDSWWNSPFRWVFQDAFGGTPYNIHNEWNGPRTRVASQFCR